MVNDENQSPDDVAEALQRSEALRAANEGAPNNGNGNFTIRINVGGNVSVSNEQQGTSTIRQRRTGADSTSLQQDESSSNNANRNYPAPVHARTIDRFPGQNNQGGSIRRVHIQNANGGQPIRVVSTGQRVNQRRVQLQRAHHGQAVRVSPGNGNAQVRIVRNTGQPQMQQQQQQVARVQLPPLAPQPLPYHGSHVSSGNAGGTSNESSSDQHHEDRNDFKCLICFEFLQNPASCGKCASRFCNACILRVAATGTSDAPAKCPTCRCEFQMSDITLDADLKERIQRANTVTCQYEGCNAQLSLNQVAIHEQTCLFVPIKCRYASFGCEWKGTRQTLIEHEATCSLMQVSSLVEQFRQTRADHGHALNHLQTRVAASNAMMELHASLLRRLQMRSYHPGDILDLIYTVTCTPARFIYTKDVWRSLTACRLSRGFLCNVLAFLPTTLLVLRTVATCFRQFVKLDSLAWNDEKEIDRLFDAVEDSIAVWFFALFVTLFVRLGKTSAEWAPNTQRIRRFLHGMVPVLSFFLHYVAVHLGSGFLSWLFLCICSAFFPSLVLNMIEMVNGLTQTRPTNVLSAGRALPVVLFGIRYGLVASLTGIPACLDAVMAQSVLRKFQSERLAPLFVKDDCFFTDIPRSVRIVYVSFHVLLTFVIWNAGMPLSLFDSIFACVLLHLVNYLVNNLFTLGNTLATCIYQQAKENVLANQAGVRKVCNLTGCLSFAVWLLLLGGIVLAY